MKTTIFFLPEAGIRPFMRPLCVLAAGLKNQGQRVIFTQCTGEMIRCPMFPYMRKSSANISIEEKAKMCAACSNNFQSAQQHYGFEVVSLKDILTEKIIVNINQLVDTASLLEEIKYDGFPVGKIAQYDFGLERKQLYNESLDKDHRDLFIAYIKNTALALALANEIYYKYKPDTFVTFNVYAQCQSVRYAATKNNALSFHIHLPSFMGIDGSLFEVYDKFVLYHLYQDWNCLKDIPIPEKRVISSWEDVIFRNYQQGSHIYSISKGKDPEEIAKQLKLNTKRKIIIAYTTSEDELLGGKNISDFWKDHANRGDAFNTQVEWLQFLRRYVKTRNDIQIVVRVHPREGKNKSYTFGSNYLEQLKAEFNVLEENFIFVWPEDPISSYDLLELASGVLFRNSTMGLEAARIGIPGLSYVKNYSYQDDDFIRVGSTIAEYKEKLDSMIAMQYTFKHLVKAIRYNHMRMFLHCLDLSETVPKDMFDSVWPLPPRNKEETIMSILNNEIKIFDYNKADWQANLPANAEDVEAKAVRYGIRLFLDKTFYPDPEKEAIMFRIKRRLWSKLTGKIINLSGKPFGDYSLKFSDDISKIKEFIQQTRKNKHTRILVADGMYAILVHKGKVLRRMSPMVIKLAKLHGSEI